MAIKRTGDFGKSSNVNLDFENLGISNDFSSSWGDDAWGDSNDWGAPKRRRNKPFTFGKQEESFESAPYDDWESDESFVNSFANGSWGAPRSRYGKVRTRSVQPRRPSSYGGHGGYGGYARRPHGGRGGTLGDILRREGQEIQRIFMDVLNTFRIW